MAEKSKKLAGMSEEELNARHAEKMKKKKAARDKIIATKTVEKGLVIVHTGKGKGKSTAAFGMVFRALGNGMRVGVVQFVKGKVGDRRTRAVSGKIRQIRSRWRRWAKALPGRPRTASVISPLPAQAWEKAKAMIMDEKLDMVLCDELNIVLRYDYLPVEEILAVLKSKPEMKHVIITGRNAKEELIEFADLVTEMEMVKHPFRSGVKGTSGYRVLT